MARVLPLRLVAPYDALPRLRGKSGACTALRFTSGRTGLSGVGILFNLSAMPTFAEYLEKWLKQSTAQGLTNPLVKMPVKRFRLLQPDEFSSLANGGSLIIGTMSDPIARNLHKNFQTRIRERGEHCAFVCSGSVEMIVAGATESAR